jgi:glucose/arabinose dehydrogenase
MRSLRTSLFATLALVAACLMPGLALAETPPTTPTGTAATPSQPPAPTPSPTPTQSPAAATKVVRARVLTKCEHGDANDLVDLPEDVAKAAKEAGLVDTSKAAVAYAAGLSQNRPKPNPADDAL